MKVLLWLFSSATLFATVNEPLRLEWSTGYRNDHIHWHLQDPGDESAVTYRELYRDVEFWENSLSLKAIHRDLTFFLKGSYGAFGRGNLEQAYMNSPDKPEFHFRTDGWSADARGYFGYAVNLTDGRTYKCVAIPTIGYSGHFERLKRSDGRPYQGGASAFLGSLQLPQDFRQGFWGWDFGVSFLIEPVGDLIFTGGWAYHLFHARVHSGVSRRAQGNTFDEEFYSFKVKKGGSRGQSGWVEMDFKLPKKWRAGIGSQIDYFSSSILDVDLKPIDLSQKLKVRWTSVSGYSKLSKEF
jgi:hypothetical protein